MRKLRKEANLEAIKATVVNVRATQKCDVLIVLDKASNKEDFTVELEIVVEHHGEVRADSKKVTLEI